MQTKHAQLRSQQRGIQRNIAELLKQFGDAKRAPKGCLIRYFGKKAIREIEYEFGRDFVARNHENFKAYLIESSETDIVVTLGKLHKNQKLTSSKPNRIYH
jgi:hypothetical protein